ncbi:MAG TPA: VOC family protein, partial [Verrucomicrobiae bacterium]|nr:VOC family protein [Verrucomicrobiae bacterium]
NRCWLALLHIGSFFTLFPLRQFEASPLALRVETTDQAERFFAALSQGGQIQVPIQKTFFADRYGIVLDRFGLSWKIMVESKTQN